MKRDMDLIRKLLLQLEGDSNTKQQDKDVSSYNPLTVNYHKYLIIDAKLASGTTYMTTGSGGVMEGMMTHLTWEGHDFIDSIRNDSLWMKVKDNVKKGVTTVSMETLKQVVSYVAKQMMGMHG
ncbi:MAG TPA: DUF2513 domain-containing protein [Gemmatales bacterium]|nr:DUF2513 domain-containing protein [Gemmatales bacterium]